MRQLGFLSLDRRRSHASASEAALDAAARTSELRRTLRVASALIAVVQVMAGASFGVRYPDHAAAFLTVFGAGAIASFALFVIANRAAPRLVTPLTVVLMFIPLTILVGPAIEPRTLITVASGLAQLPVAVPLFVAWTRRVRTGWLVAFAVVGLITVVTGFNELQDFERMDLATDIVIGAFLGWLGGELRERMRERNWAQEAELRRLNGELEIRATTDALTGLANRRQLDSDLQILSSPRPGRTEASSFIMLDLDSFKRLNDQLGHAAGDEALRRVSAEIQRVIRRRDTIYRYGGEEFLVMLRDSSPVIAAAAAERIRAAIADLGIPAGSDPAIGTLTISGGVATSLSARDQWGTELAAADKALYEAKASGRDRIVVAPAVVYDVPAAILSDRRHTEPSLPESGLDKGPVRLAG